MLLWSTCRNTGLKRTDFTLPYLVQLLFGDLLSDRCVVLLEVQYKSQQATFSLVAHLLRQTSLHIRRLRQRKKKNSISEGEREQRGAGFHSRVSLLLETHQDL